MSDNEFENMSGTDPEGNSSKESDFQSAMLKMMSDFKADILANVKESYQLLKCTKILDTLMMQIVMKINNRKIQYQ